MNTEQINISIKVEEVAPNIYYIPMIDCHFGAKTPTEKRQKTVAMFKLFCSHNIFNNKSCI